MKKLIFVFSVIALILSSCSDNENSQPPVVDTNTILLKKAIISEGSNQYTVIYTYNGNKIVKQESDSGEYSLYTYSGDNIIKIEYFSAPSVLDYIENYVYDSSGRLIQFTDIEGSTGSKEVYSYNSNGTISLNMYSGNQVEQNTLEATGTINLQNGEVVSRVENYSFGQTSYTMSYDSKNTPFKNVTGYSKTKLKDSESFFGTNHNTISSSVIFQGNTPSTVNYSYTYNSNDFPVNCSSNSSTPGGNQTFQLFYQ